MTDAQQLPLPPSSMETAAQKVRLADDGWTIRDPARVVDVYTTDSNWRTARNSLMGRDVIVAFPTANWRELEYRSIKELYEGHDDSGNWFGSFAHENWEFDELGGCEKDLPA